MTPVRLIARPLLASVFISGGINALRAPKAHGEMAQPVVDKVAEPLNLPQDPELLAQVNGGVMIGAGALLALGKLPRLASTALAVTLVPTTMAEHRFWEASDDDERDAQRIHFMKNLGLLGGLVLAAVDTEGKPGVAWRARHAGGSARREAKAAKRAAKAATKAAKCDMRARAKVAGAEGRRMGSKAAAALPG